MTHGYEMYSVGNIVNNYVISLCVNRWQWVDSLEKTLMLGRLKATGEGDDRGQDCWMASLTQWTSVWTSFGVGEGQGSLACCSPWGCKVSHDWTTITLIPKPDKESMKK